MTPGYGTRSLRSLWPILLLANGTVQTWEVNKDGSFQLSWPTRVIGATQIPGLKLGLFFGQCIQHKRAGLILYSLYLRSQRVLYLFLIIIYNIYPPNIYSACACFRVWAAKVSSGNLERSYRRAPKGAGDQGDFQVQGPGICHLCACGQGIDWENMFPGFPNLLHIFYFLCCHMFALESDWVSNVSFYTKCFFNISGIPLAKG